MICDVGTSIASCAPGRVFNWAALQAEKKRKKKVWDVGWRVEDQQQQQQMMMMITKQLHR